MAETKTAKSTTKTKAKSKAEVTESQPSFVPPTGTRVCAPIKRKRKGTPVSHEANFKFGDATNTYVLPIINANGRKKYKNPFHSEEEREYLEEKLGADLNPHRVDNEFFADFHVELGKGKTNFDLSDPIDLLSVRVLECWKDEICLNPEDRLNKLTYKYILSEDGFQEVESENLADRKVELMAFYSKIKNKKPDLVSFLKLRGKRPADNAKVNWLNAAVFDEMEANPTECYALIVDENREWKILLDRALSAKAVILTKDNGYVLRDHVEPFAHNKDNAVLYIKDPKNSEELQLIRAQIKEYEDNRG